MQVRGLTQQVACVHFGVLKPAARNSIVRVLCCNGCVTIGAMLLVLLQPLRRPSSSTANHPCQQQRLLACKLAWRSSCWIALLHCCCLLRFLVAIAACVTVLTRLCATLRRGWLGCYATAAATTPLRLGSGHKRQLLVIMLSASNHLFSRHRYCALVTSHDNCHATLLNSRCSLLSCSLSAQPAHAAPLCMRTSQLLLLHN
jgi:hypothetical protein